MAAAAQQTAVVLHLDPMMLVEEVAPALMTLVEEAAVALADLTTAKEVETVVLDLMKVEEGVVSW